MEDYENGTSGVPQGPTAELIQEIVEIFENLKATKGEKYSQTVLFFVHYTKMYFTCVMHEELTNEFKDLQKLFFIASLGSLKVVLDLPKDDFKEALSLGIRVSLKSLGFQSEQVQNIMKSIKKELDQI